MKEVHKLNIEVQRQTTNQAFLNNCYETMQTKTTSEVSPTGYQTNRFNNSVPQVHIPLFIFDRIPHIKKHIIPHYYMANSIQEEHYKLYLPHMKEQNIQLVFRNGDYLYLATPITEGFNSF